MLFRSNSDKVALTNGNLLLGEYKNNSYDYYEVSKDGNKMFITNSKYYIEDINKETGNFITAINENDKYYLGVLDKEFKVIYNNIFYYKDNAFTESTEILKIKDGGYGVFSINGSEIIEPIFESIKKIDNNTFECIYNNKPYILKKYNNLYINQTAINNVDSWAKESVEKAIKLNLVSQNLQLKLTSNITREEFCEILIKLYEEKTGFEINIDNKNPFVDTDNKYVLKAYSLGIVSGKSKNKFEPNMYITREESAVILSNIIKKMEYKVTETSTTYKDEHLISDWSKESIQVVSNAGNIMIGDTKGNFNPKNNYKIVEAISTVMRLYNLK